MAEIGRIMGFLILSDCQYQSGSQQINLILQVGQIDIWYERCFAVIKANLLSEVIFAAFKISVMFDKFLRLWLKSAFKQFILK